MTKTPRQQILESISHAELQQNVIDWLHVHGWKVAGFRPGMIRKTYTNKKGEERNLYKTPILADGEGFPDLLAFKYRVIGIEIKTEKDKLKKSQQRWQKWFSLAGVKS